MTDTAKLPLYLPLPQSETLRVLQINPAKDHQPLTGSLTICQLQRNTVTDEYTASHGYIAISYVWGDPTSTHIINLSDHELPITRSAHEVLSRLRSVLKPVTVWIDAICINQQDTAERAHQVSFMHRIYALAKSTFVWIGLASDDSTSAIEFASKLDTKTFNDDLRAEVRSEGNLTTSRQILDILPDTIEQHKVILACARLLCRTWFSRLWIQQEAALCKDTIVVCGKAECSWDHIFSLGCLLRVNRTMQWPDWFQIDYDVLRRHLQTIMYVQRYRLETANVIANVAGSHVIEIFPARLALSSRPNQATDPRDRVYALRNLVPTPHEWSPGPNYTISWQVLYIEVAKMALAMAAARHSGAQYWILGQAGTIRNGNGFEVPSWVPDWRIFPMVQFTLHNAWWPGGPETFKYKLSSLNRKQRYQVSKALRAHQVSTNLYEDPVRAIVLHVPCLMRDTIEFLSDSAPGWVLDRTNADQSSIKVNTIISHIENHIAKLNFDRYLGGESFANALAATLIASTDDDENLHTISTLPSYSEWRDYMTSPQNHSDTTDKTKPTYQLALEHNKTFTSNVIGITTHGYLCLVPEATQPTDTIAIIRGGRMPVVLRPVTSDFSLLIGDCYVHGMMENTAGLVIEEYSIKFDRDGIQKLKDPIESKRTLGVGAYDRIFPTLGERWISLI